MAYTQTVEDVTLPGQDIEPQAGFPHAPANWSTSSAEARARAEGLALTDDHWEVLRALQDYYAKHGGDTAINVRELHDALDERFHARGGIKRLFMIFPGGPVAQGCRIAGLQAPPGAVDRGFGSVV